MFDYSDSQPTEISLPIKNLRKIRNEDVEKRRILESTVNDLKRQHQLDLNQKDELISKLTLELEAVKCLFGTDAESENVEKASTAHSLLEDQNLSSTEMSQRYRYALDKVHRLEAKCLQLDMKLERLTLKFVGQQIEFRNILKGLNSDIMAIQEKFNTGCIVRSPQENFEKETCKKYKALNITNKLSVAEIRCEEQSRGDESTQLNIIYDQIKPIVEPTQTYVTSSSLMVSESKSYGDSESTMYSFEETNYEAGSDCNFESNGTIKYHQAEEWESKAGPSLKKQSSIAPERNDLMSPVHTQQRGAVMMVYGLDENTCNTDRLFNLFCLYGNVVRIQILKREQGAIVEMGDCEAVNRCIRHLNYIPVGSDGQLEIRLSEKNTITKEIRPRILSDNTPAYKDYTSSNNIRFLMPGETSNSQIFRPSKVLRFCNTPPTTKEINLRKLFNLREIYPKDIRLIPQKSELSPRSGFIEFRDIFEAVLTVIKCNNLPIMSQDTQFAMNLSFSSTNIMTQWMHQHCLKT